VVAAKKRLNSQDFFKEQNVCESERSFDNHYEKPEKINIRDLELFDGSFYTFSNLFRGDIMLLICFKTACQFI
jgi:hypothetical protein